MGVCMIYNHVIGLLTDRYLIKQICVTHTQGFPLSALNIAQSGRANTVSSLSLRLFIPQWFKMRKHRFFDFELLLKFNFYVKLFKSKIRNTQPKIIGLGIFIQLTKRTHYTLISMHTIESSIQKYRIESLLFVIFKAIRRSLITKTRIFKSHAISIIIIFHLSLDIIAKNGILDLSIDKKKKKRIADTKR